MNWGDFAQGFALCWMLCGIVHFEAMIKGDRNEGCAHNWQVLSIVFLMGPLFGLSMWMDEE